MSPLRYPDVVSVVNLKGGVGKTTLCVNLAYGLAYFRNFRVLLVDLDPQANATQYLISQQTYRKLYLTDPFTKFTVTEVFGAFAQTGLKAPGPLKDPDRYIQRIFKGQTGYLDLLASKLELSLLAFEGGQVQRNGQIRWFIQNVADRYDIVLIDCPPTVSRMLMSGFEASDFVLVPIKAEFLATIGLPLLHQVISSIYPNEIARRENWQADAMRVLGIVYTMHEAHLNMTSESEADVEEVAERHGYDIFDARLTRSTKFAWSSKTSLPVFRTEPRSRYANQIEEVVSEFVARLEKQKKASNVKT